MVLYKVQQKSFVSTVFPLCPLTICSARIHSKCQCFCFDFGTRFVLRRCLNPFLVCQLFREEDPSTLFFVCMLQSLCGPSSTAALSYTKQRVPHLPWLAYTFSSQPCKLRCISGILPNMLCLLPPILGSFLVLWCFYKSLMSF